MQRSSNLQGLGNQSWYRRIIAANRARSSGNSGGSIGHPGTVTLTADELAIAAGKGAVPQRGVATPPAWQTNPIRADALSSQAGKDALAQRGAAPMPAWKTNHIRAAALAAIPNAPRPSQMSGKGVRPYQRTLKPAPRGVLPNPNKAARTLRPTLSKHRRPAGAGNGAAGNPGRTQRRHLPGGLPTRKRSAVEPPLAGATAKKKAAPSSAAAASSRGTQASGSASMCAKGLPSQKQVQRPSQAPLPKPKPSACPALAAAPSQAGSGKSRVGLAEVEKAFQVIKEWMNE